MRNIPLDPRTLALPDCQAREKRVSEICKYELSSLAKRDEATAGNDKIAMGLALNLELLRDIVWNNYHEYRMRRTPSTTLDAIYGSITQEFIRENILTDGVPPLCNTYNNSKECAQKFIGHIENIINGAFNSEFELKRGLGSR